MSPALREHMITQLCPQKEALIEEIRGVIQQIMQAYNAEVEAVLSGDFNADKINEAKLSTLRQLKGELITRYRQHTESHGCDC